MDNPGLLSVIQFLTNMREMGRANFSQITNHKGKGYGMVSRYIKFCLKFDLIKIVEVKKNSRGRYPSKVYSISEKGEIIVNMFAEPPEVQAPTEIKS